MRLAVLTAMLLAAHLLLSAIYRISSYFPVSHHAYVAGTLMLAGIGLVFLVASTGRKAAGQPSPGIVEGMAGGLIATRGPGKLPASGATAAALVLGVLPGLYLRYRYIAGYPIDSRYGDMLPLAKSACLSFLRGEYPYTIHQVPHELPLTFMPMLWASYLPAVGIGFDLRIIGLAASATIMALYLKIFHDQWKAAAAVSPGSSAEGGARAAALATLLLMLMFSYSTAISAFTMIGHTQPLWMYVALFSYFFIRDDCFPAAVFLALSVASRQTMVVLVPFVLLYWAGCLPRRKALKSALLFAGVTGTLCLPFALVSPESFLLRPLRHYVELGRYYMVEPATQHHILDTFGFAGLFYLNGLEGYLGFASLAVWGLMVWWGSRVIDGASSALACMGVTLFFFYFFSPVPWFYIYVPALLLLSFAVIGRSVPPPCPSSGRTRP